MRGMDAPGALGVLQDIEEAKRELAAAESRLKFVLPEFEQIAYEQYFLARKKLDLAIARAKTLGGGENGLDV